MAGMRHHGPMEVTEYIGSPAAEPAVGRLLVASPLLGVPFHRAVVLILEYDESGTLGVVLNQPTSVDVGSVLPMWREHITGEPHVFQGGPVSLDSALGLAAAQGHPEGFRRVSGELGVVDLDTPADALAPHLAAMRIYAGYAGWAPGQLDAEIDEGAWAVVDAVDPVAQAFWSDPDHLWAATLQRAGGTLAWWPTCPPDPSVN